MSETKQTPFRDALKIVYIAGSYDGPQDKATNEMKDKTVDRIAKCYPAENAAQELLGMVKILRSRYEKLIAEYRLTSPKTLIATMNETAALIGVLIAKATKKGE